MLLGAKMAVISNGVRGVKGIGSGALGRCGWGAQASVVLQLAPGRQCRVAAVCISVFYLIVDSRSEAGLEGNGCGARSSKSQQIIYFCPQTVNITAVSGAERGRVEYSMTVVASPSNKGCKLIGPFFLLCLWSAGPLVLYAL
jgi:hypothetical protein